MQVIVVVEIGMESLFMVIAVVARAGLMLGLVKLALVLEAVAAGRD